MLPSWRRTDLLAVLYSFSEGETACNRFGISGQTSAAAVTLLLVSDLPKQPSTLSEE